MSDLEYGLEREPERATRSGDGPKPAAEIPDVVPIPPPSVTLKNIRFPKPAGARVDVDFTLPPLPPPNDGGNHTSNIWDNTQAVWQAIQPLKIAITIPGTQSPIRGNVAEADVDLGYLDLRQHRHHTFRITLDSSIPPAIPAGMVKIEISSAISVSLNGTFIGDQASTFASEFPIA